jgi:hypothetical protein
LDIVGAEIVKTASTLGNKVAKSLLVPKGNKVADIIDVANRIAELEKEDEVDPVDLEHHELGGEGGGA